MRWNSQLLALVMLTVFSSVGLASGASELKYDPFAYLENSSKIASLKATRNAAIVAPVTWRRKLLATIVAGKQSVANIDGKVVRLGEKIDGYALIAVKKKTAIFEKNKKRIVLKMTPKRNKK